MKYYCAVDAKYALPSQMTSSTAGLAWSTMLPCDAVLYEYEDIEYTKLCEFGKSDSLGYANKLSADREFEQHAMAVLARKQFFFSMLDNSHVFSRYTTYFFSKEGSELEYVSFNRYSPVIEVRRAGSASIVFEDQMSGRRFSKFSKWLRWLADEVSDLDIAFAEDEVAFGAIDNRTWAIIIIFLIKSRHSKKVIFNMN